MIADELKLFHRVGVYEPREDSYLLAEAVEKYAFGKALDLGTGCGIQGIVAAKKGCRVTFADMSEAALASAKENAEVNGVDGEFIKTDMFSGTKGKFNTLIFNPPYLHSTELSMQKITDANLDGGKNGRELIDRFIAGYKKHIEKDHVVLLLESSLNEYTEDAKRLKAEIVCHSKLFFEELAVLRFE